jgi:hypothetical protein
MGVYRCFNSANFTISRAACSTPVQLLSNDKL